MWNEETKVEFSLAVSNTILTKIVHPTAAVIPAIDLP
jgi:hypothetical protein